MLAQQEIAFENARYLAEERCQFDVLVEGAAPGRSRGRRTSGVSTGAGVFTGRCYFQAPAIDSSTWVVAETAPAVGELVRCTVVDSDGYDLIARPTAELERTVRLPLADRR